MKHLLVTGNKMKSLYTRKKPLEKDPHTTLDSSYYQLLVGKKMKMGSFFLSRIIYTISKFRLAWQFQI